MPSLNAPGKARTALARVVDAELAKCAKCGACASVCPVYAEKNSEAYCARGKLLLARALVNAAQEVTPRFAEIFNNCLVCMACVKNCGNGVRMDFVVPAARAVLAAEGLLPLGKKALYRHVLANQGTLRGVMKAASLLEPLWFASVPENSGLRRRFFVPFIAEDQPVPRVAQVPFRERVPERLAVPKGALAREVVYFTGCAANFLFPTIAESVVYVLRALGYGVFVPAKQQCCGTPMEIGGERSVAVELARQNVAILSATSGPILTGCGSGGFMLREGYPRLLEGRERKKALEVANRVRDFSEFVASADVLPRALAQIRRRADCRVTYHDPCHLARGMGVTAQPRSLLRALVREFVEMTDAGRCCGSGGLYSATHWLISRRILARKMRCVAESGAEIVATGCPSCLVQLEAGLANGSAVALHTAELLAWCLGYFPARKEERVRFSGLRECAVR